jgi:hypothetical protein
MSWETFTVDHIKARMAVRELETYEEVSRAEHDETADAAIVPVGSTDRLTLIHGQTLAQFRGAIRANPQVTEMGAAGTLPDFCIAWAAIIARAALMGLPPVEQGMTDPRRDEYRDAVEGLKSLRSMSSTAFTDSDPVAESSTAASYGGNDILDF